MTLGSTKNGGTLCNVTTHNVILTYQKTKTFVNRWLHAYAVFDVTCFPAFVEAPDVISSILSIWPNSLVTWNLLFHNDKAQLHGDLRLMIWFLRKDHMSSHFDENWCTYKILVFKNEFYFDHCVKCYHGNFISSGHLQIDVRSL